ncbi:MAG TPA: hypothetical protein VNW92_20320 [Polyangiaceae bacterium]|jgi:hypothetical protein|nr:hypothetical protein [Polyangiaceae bacterium]
MRAGRHTASRALRSAPLALLATLALSALRSGEPERRTDPVLVNALELACFSDGVACSHAADCCSAGCVNGRCGERLQPKRRLAMR